MITIDPAILFGEAMPNAGRDGDDYLLSGVVIGNCLFHAEAIAVEDPENYRCLTALDPTHQEKIECAYTISGEYLSTMEYLGKHWVVIITPQSK